MFRTVLLVKFLNNQVSHMFNLPLSDPGFFDRAKAFLEEVLKVYTTKFMKASRMLGDQLALAWVVKSHPSFDARMFTKRQAFLHEVSGASVLFLPCSAYNWTPPEGAGQFHGMPLDVKVHTCFAIRTLTI